MVKSLTMNKNFMPEEGPDNLKSRQRRGVRTVLFNLLALKSFGGRKADDIEKTPTSNLPVRNPFLYNILKFGAATSHKRSRERKWKKLGFGDSIRSMVSPSKNWNILKAEPTSG